MDCAGFLGTGEELRTNLVKWEAMLKGLYFKRDEEKEVLKREKYSALGYNLAQVDYIMDGPADGKYSDERTKLCWFYGRNRRFEYKVHRWTREFDVLHGHLADEHSDVIPLNMASHHQYSRASDRLTKLDLKYREETGNSWYDNY